MRQIKFRAKEKETNMWVYGQLYNYGIKDDIESCAIIDDKFTVHSAYSDSVQQFTGLKDKEGKDIYEGDILYNSSMNEGYVVVYQEARFVVYDMNSHVLVTSLCGVNKNINVAGNNYDLQVRYVY